MTKSHESTTAVPAVTGAHAHVSSKLETVPGVAPVTMETTTKEDRCPEWCVSDHQDDGAVDYDCHTGGIVLNLPNHVGDNAVNGRNVPWAPDRRGHSIEVRRSMWTVEQTDDPDDDRWTRSTDESVELSMDNSDPIGLLDDEVETLIGVLQLTLDQKRRYSQAEAQRFTR